MADNMKVSIEGKDLVIKIRLQKPEPSKSGKTRIVATSSGLVKTGVKLKDGPGKGEEITVGVNAFIPLD